jgi:ribonuclease HI
MLLINTDGGARGNPGPGAIGIIFRKESTIVNKYSQFIGNFVTNNIAEYEALVKALEIALTMGEKEITCFLDSELVVKQLLGQYQVKDPKLTPFFIRIQKLQDNFDRIGYAYVSREDKFQIMADELVNLELEKRGYKKKIPRRY